MGIFDKTRTALLGNRLSDRSGVFDLVSECSPGQFRCSSRFVDFKIPPDFATVFEWRKTAVLASCCRLL